ncbi:UNVERIFIED_CONTAM: hypothetical protein Sradi_1637800 [Sesamum radiatum]|uniref:Uncharacterized protein n=1 Tax=Sesamum radiatum TaxID=300843 RepID=A0AAW2UEM8_SESRA
MKKKKKERGVEDRPEGGGGGRRQGLTAVDGVSRRRTAGADDADADTPSSRAGEGVVAGRRLAVVGTSHSRCLASRVFNLGGRGRSGTRSGCSGTHTLPDTRPDQFDRVSGKPEPDFLPKKPAPFSLNPIGSGRDPKNPTRSPTPNPYRARNLPGRENRMELYLGLPSRVSRSKRDLFATIRDSIWRKITGWNENFLSHAGKEVLIKAVVQAVPTYAMGCFKLPITLLKEIQGMIANFWWGNRGH